MSIFARYDDDILVGATIGGTTPSTSYALSTLGLGLPAARVRWPSTVATIDFTLGSSQRGDVLVIPTSNLDPGSSSVLTLTNGAGLSEAVPIAALQANGVPKTTIFDIEAAEPNVATRTSATWHLLISGNSSNIQMGGAVSIYGAGRVLTPDFLHGFQVQNLNAVDEQANEYLTRYRVNYRSVERSVGVTVRALASQVGAIRDWSDAAFGSGRPSLFWPDRAELDAYYGTLDQAFSMKHVEGDIYDVPIVFRELSKGQPF